MLYWKLGDLDSPMKIENPRLIDNEGHAELVLLIDGVESRLTAEAKPTLVRHGIVPVESRESNKYRAKLPDGREVSRCSDDPKLFRLWVKFLLDERFGREFQPGPIDPTEAMQLDIQLQGAALTESKPFLEYLGFI